MLRLNSVQVASLLGAREGLPAPAERIHYCNSVCNIVRYGSLNHQAQEKSVNTPRRTFCEYRILTKTLNNQQRNLYSALLYKEYDSFREGKKNQKIQIQRYADCFSIMLCCNYVCWRIAIDKPSRLNSFFTALISITHRL